MGAAGGAGGAGAARVAVFRWKALGPLLVLGALGAAAWLLFADRLARRAAESVGTAVVGAKVEIRKLHLALGRGRVEVRGLIVASPFDGFKNLFEAEELVAHVAPLPLLEKKLVIERLAANGLRFGTPRRTDGRTGGRPDGVMGQVRRWAAEVQVPVVRLVTGKIDVGRLDPGQLSVPRAARALAARVDSAKQAWDAELRRIDVAGVVDSTRRMLEGLRGARPTDVRLLGDARRGLDRLKQTRDRVAALERDVRAGVAMLETGAGELNDARQRDYAFARGLLKLPSLDAPDVGAALFGPAALQRFQQALYWAELARRYMPPGLLPRASAGPKRLRRAGVTVRFPREHENPALLLKSGELSFQLPRGGALRSYAARLTGLTSDPALYGRPTTLEAEAPGVRAAALLDHVGRTARDTAGGSIAGVPLPELGLPSLPVRLDPGEGTVALGFALHGDSVQARWSVSADRVRWIRDTAAAPSQVGDLVWRVASGIPRLDVSASLGGTLAQPRLSVRSNLDRALAERIRAVAGEEIAAAERRVRAQVDSLVEKEAAAARAAVTALAGDIPRQLGVQQAELDQAQRALEQRLKELTRLPGVRLP